MTVAQGVGRRRDVVQFVAKEIRVGVGGISVSDPERGPKSEPA
ncbi:hypothetical protein I548_3445 [Mycobacterium intracellulare]|nr:hypothetical protein I548_3445 [Mycobacterium intracellulare]